MAVLWNKSGVANFLGTLGGATSGADGINEAGQVVGSALIADNHTFHAFITGADGVGMTDLNSLVTLESGVYLTGAVDVNDVGQIIANGSNGHAYLISTMIPEPEIYTLILAGLGLLGLTEQHRKKRR